MASQAPATLEATRKAISSSSGGTSSRALKNAVMRLLGAPEHLGDVADWGAGTGDLTRALLETHRFTSLTAFDLWDRPPDLPPHVRWYTADLNEPVDCPSSSFDLVVSLGVIEYMENPYAFTRELFRIVRPRGRLILSTPNNESWRSLVSLICRGYFCAFPVHGNNFNLTALLQSDFEKILELAGFRNITFSGSGSGMFPKLPVSWQSLSGGLLRGLRYNDDLIVTCEKPS